MNTAKEIKFPIVLFLDDGADVFKTLRDAEFAQEPIDVRDNPAWFGYGYDSNGNGLRLGVDVSERKILGFKCKRECVRLICDLNLQLAIDNNAKEKMVEYLLRTRSLGSKELVGKLSTEELLREMVK